MKTNNERKALSAGREYQYGHDQNKPHLRREKSTSVAIEIKNGPVLPGSNVTGMMVNTWSSEVVSNMNPGGVETSWVGTIGDPSYGRPS